MQCEVADESVVVMKFRPVKPGNRVEGKTGMTCSLICGSWLLSKAWSVSKGGSISEDFWKLELMTEPGTSCSTEQDSLSAVNCDKCTADLGRPLEYSGEFFVNCRKDRMQGNPEEEPRRRVRNDGRRYRNITW
jgi:hypothetical protein